MNTGKIVEIIGPVLDVHFDQELPAIYNALEITAKKPDGSEIFLVAEVEQHLGDNKVRAVAMDSTDGLARGMEVVDTGQPLSVPVGEVTLGRLFNLIGGPSTRASRCPRTWSGGPSTVRPRPSPISSPQPRCSRRASRSLTCWLPT